MKLNAKFTIMPRLTAMLLLVGCFADYGVSVAEDSPFLSSLESKFLNRPESSKSNAWWHWMNGCISQQGTTADLEAMKKAVVGVGVHLSCGYAAFRSTGVTETKSIVNDICRRKRHCRSHQRHRKGNNEAICCG